MLSYGLLNLDKPSGLTSRNVVDRVQRLVRPSKVGHAGTLDPLATGVLVVCTGAATRLIEFVQQQPKHYEGTFLLGRQSPTEDIEGDVTELAHPPVPTLEQIRSAACALTGPILQRPPAFSALKVAGRRAYDLARRGQQVQFEPRPVTIHALEVLAYDYPALVLRIECSSGTYVRSLGRDLAQSLGTAAVMSALVRTAVGPFRLEEAVAPDALTAENLSAHVRPALDAVAHLPRVRLAPDQAQRIRQGQTIALATATPDAAELAAVDDSGALVAILVPRAAGFWRPSRTLPPP